MSNASKKQTLFADNNQSDEGAIDFAPGMERRIRKVNPLGFRVLVRISKDRNVSEGGLYLPEGAKQNMDESLLAEVIEVASASDDREDSETNISGIPMGATILIPKSAGVRVPWDQDLRIVETKEVLAIVHEVNVD